MPQPPPFDPTRAMLEDYLDGSQYPPHLTVTDSIPLQEALAQGQIASDTRLLTFTLQERLYATPMTVVLSYNVIQGEVADQPWMMTFCNACNTGSVFSSQVDGQTLRFQRRGAYEGLLLIWDRETGSYWQHITGQALHGPSRGQQLTMLSGTRQMTTAEVLAQDAEARMYVTALSPEQQKLSRYMERMRANPAVVQSGIISTVVTEDTRRPRFELGLGVWTAERSCFFPLEQLYARDNAWITTFEGRTLLIYQVPDALAPVAAYVDVKSASFAGDVLRLNDGASIRNDQWVGADGTTQALERPPQMLMRWYGFAVTFPGCALPDA
jgi:hypothetical protein